MLSNGNTHHYLVMFAAGGNRLDGRWPIPGPAANLGRR